MDRSGYNQLPGHLQSNPNFHNPQPTPYPAFPAQPPQSNQIYPPQRFPSGGLPPRGGPIYGPPPHLCSHPPGPYPGQGQIIQPRGMPPQYPPNFPLTLFSSNPQISPSAPALRLSGQASGVPFPHPNSPFANLQNQPNQGPMGMPAHLNSNPQSVMTNPQLMQSQGMPMQYGIPQPINPQEGMPQGMPNQPMGMSNQGMPNQGMQPMQPGMMTNQGMPNQGMPNQGMQSGMMPSQGMSNQGGMPNQGMQQSGMMGMPNQEIPGQSNPGMQSGMMAAQGMPNQAMPNQGMNGMQGMIPPQNQGMPNQGMNGMPNGMMSPPGMQQSGMMASQGMQQTGMMTSGMQGMQNQGMQNQGMNGMLNQGMMSPPGMQQSGMMGIPNQGMPMQPGMMSSQGMPNQGMNGMQGMPNQGMNGMQQPMQSGMMTNQGMPNQMLNQSGMQGMPNQGMPNQGILNQSGMQMQPGMMPNQGIPNQMLNQSGMQGMPNQGMPNQGMPNQPGQQGVYMNPSVYNSNPHTSSNGMPQQGGYPGQNPQYTPLSLPAQPQYNQYQPIFPPQNLTSSNRGGPPQYTPLADSCGPRSYAPMSHCNIPNACYGMPAYRPPQNCGMNSLWNPNQVSQFFPPGSYIVKRVYTLPPGAQLPPGTQMVQMPSPAGRPPQPLIQKQEAPEKESVVEELKEEPTPTETTADSKSETKTEVSESAVSSVWSPMTAIGEVTANFVSNKLAGLERLFSGKDDLQSLSPPPAGYTLQIFEGSKSMFDEEVTEQLYYFFRRIGTTDSKGLTSVSKTQLFSSFSVPIPSSLCNVIVSMFCLHESGKLYFNEFVRTLSVIALGSQEAKLNLIFETILQTTILEGTHHETKKLVYSKHLIASCLEIGKVMKDIKFASEVDFEQIIQQTFSSLEEISSDVFVESTKESFHWVFCFGLIPFLLSETVEKVQILKPKGAAPTMSSHLPSKEGFLKKQFTLAGESFLSKKSYKWCVVADGFFYYYDDLKNYTAPQRVSSLVNAQIEPFLENSTGSYGFKLTIPPAYSRRFFCESKKSCLQWASVIQQNIPVPHAFDARFPIRPLTEVCAFVDGKETFKAVLDAMLLATKEIFITDWFFSCEVYLNRETPKNDQTRLDLILQQKAKEGVVICILLWNETKIATSLSSEYVQRKMESLHSNIKVLRHPLAYPVIWSHHQKTVIIDQNIAFVGGLDLSFGRWDDGQHRLFDPEGAFWPGKDYYNPAVSGFVGLQDPWSDQIDRKKVPRLPWHDVHMVLKGGAARDVAINFIERWNSSKEDLESMQNQYFISSLSGSPVVNPIAEALFLKLKHSIENKTTFRVIIVLPVHPEGSYKDDASIRCIMNWQLQTIYLNENSIIKQLQKAFPTSLKLDDYLQFTCLRAFDKVPGQESYDTEQIYVHTKMIIVDDKHVIIGSANINDRSMCGDRDSEIACLVSDGELFTSKMNGEDFQASRFAYNLRMKLWSEHLGINPGDSEQDLISDPVCVSSTLLWQKITEDNTRIFRKVFPYAPHDGIDTLDSPLFQESSNSNYYAELSQIRGHIVQYPLQFLSGMSLAPDNLSDVHLNLADTEIFT